MCGVVGIIAQSPVNQLLFDALTTLQHRGQDAAGIVTWHNGVLNLRKAKGLVRNVFHTRHMLRLRGKMGIGHVRYRTAGEDSHAEAQPFYVNSPYGITLAHNGNLTNRDELSKILFREDLRHLNTGSDSEVLLNIFAHELQQQAKVQVSAGIVFSAVSEVHRRCQGAYAAVAMINGFGIVGFRDPRGIRPLCYGVRDSGKGKEYMFASESGALESSGFTLVADIAPGQAVLIELGGKVHEKMCAESVAPPTPCIFEYVYIARPDAVINGISVYESRRRMGEALARKIQSLSELEDIDVVMPIPETSRTVALSLALSLGLIYREGFVKNPYVGRTFIMPLQKQRKKSVQQKLNTIRGEFEGKNVLLVDDSIVRGTTAKEIIEMARNAGAKKVYFASAAPPVRFPNVYGIAVPTCRELIAHERTDEEIGPLLGADALIYQNMGDLITAVQGEQGEIKHFDCSVFTGEYVVGDIDKNYLDALAESLARPADGDTELLDLNNDS